MTRGNGFIDMVDKRVGRLRCLILDICRRGNHNQAYWICICDCGRLTSTAAQHLRNGQAMSCGCLGRENNIAARTSHGETAGGEVSKEYDAYMKMISRCYDASSRDYPRWGGRGITICDRWRHGQDGKTGFSCFLSDMGRAPIGTSIDRHPDNNGHYELSNCRWATPEQQARNTRATVMIEVDGQSVSLRDVCAVRGLNFTTVYSRVKRGWPVSEALQRPIGNNYGGRQ